MKRTSAHPWQRLLLLVGALLAGAVFAVPAWGQFGQRVVLSDSWVVLTEGKSKTFTVKLATRPSNGPQQVTLIVTGESYVTVSPTSLTFTTIDWNFPQTVTVRAYHDTDKADDTATVNLTGLGITSGSVSVTVDDDDDVDVGLKLSALDSLNEGGSKTFTVKLAAKPGNARRVTLAVTGDSDVTVSPASLGFTTTNWNTAQTVTVRAAQDADKHHEIAEIAFSGDQIGYASLSVRIDDDEADIELDIKDFPLGSLAEGSSHTFQVKLKTHPGAAGRTVSVSSSNSDVTISPASLNFTASNWNDWKTVTLTAAQDADSVDDFVRFGLSGNQIRGESRTVRIADDGTFAGLSIYPSFPAFTMYEGGISYAPKVSLNRNPGANRTVNISSSNPDVTVSPASLIFTPSNWSQPQTVSFTGVQDADSDDETALITFSGNQIGIESFSITVRDDDGDAVLDISSSSFPSHLFEGSSDTFGVRLSRKPGANRTVNMSSNNSDVTVSPASLNFTPANWSQPQTVTLTAAQDADSDDERFALIAFSGDQIRSESHSVLIADDDNDGDAELDISWFSSLSPLREGVGSTTLRVRLKIKPGASRTVNMSSSNPDVTVSPASLTFTPSNWSDWKTVTLTAAQDADSDDETAVIAVSGNQIGIESRSVKVLDDDGDAELHPSSFPSHLFEGSSNTFSVGLRVKPGANRTVSMSSSNSDVTVSPASLTFTPSNWNKNQTVTLTAAQDADSDDEFALIAFSGEQIGGDSRSRSIRIFDDDADAGVNLSSFPFSLGEGGSDTFSVRLTRKPGANRTVNVSSGNPDVTVSPSSLSFTASNWSQSQTVTLRVAQDADSDDELAVIVFSGNQIRGESRSVRVNDDEADVEPAVSGFPSYLSEGSSGTFSVRLSRKPSANRTVNMSSSNPDVTLSPASLNFTASNWNKHQTVTLTAAQDADNDHDFGVIAFSGNQIRSQSRSVKVHDDEADIGLNISHFPSDSLVEGRSNNFYVGLKTNPGAAGRTVSISSSNPDVTVSPASLIFTPSNWNERQSVGLRTVQDADSDDDLGVIAFTGSQIRGASKSIKIYESAVGLNISQNSLALDEGESKTFTVKLASKPGNARKVMLTVSGDADVTVSPASLDFTTTNWNTAQNVTVRAADDSDKTKDTVRINLFGGGITAGSVSVTVADDDDVAVGLRLSQLDTLTEGGGGSKTLTVKLAAQPGSARKVTLAVTGDADVTVSRVSLNFTTSNWDTAQAVTVSAADDADKTDDTATINLTGDGITASSVSVSVDDDDDSDVGLTLSDLETLAEGGSKTFTVKLAAQPGNARRVTLAVTGDDDVTVSLASLYFSTSNWSAAQIVTVRAAHDADKIDDTATINLTGDGITAGSVSVTVTDDEKPQLILRRESFRLPERHRSSFGVKLSKQPTGNVTVAAQSSNANVVQVKDTDQNKAGHQNARTFTTSNWNVYQRFSITAPADVDTANNSATVSLTASGGGYDAATANMPVTVLDGDLVELSA
nr:hypothetical protein [Gammaproteobacteria bacterium AqS3]